jgi:chemotaxis protein MotB
MPSDEKTAPIIIIKKKGGHGGHHGGAWKVAYADFVTAMMALFIVLWLLSSDEKVKKAVGGYFLDPSGSGKLMGTNLAGIGESISISKDDMGHLKEKLEQAVKELPKFKDMKDQVQITVTSEGLRVELLETVKGMFFESGNSNPSENGKQILLSLAKEMGKLPNSIVIEGHTDSKPFSSRRGYSNWELSADRANSARSLMEGSGLREDQVKQVRGFADQQLRKPASPEDASNRRVSVIVQYRDTPPKQAESAAETAAETAAENHKKPAEKEKRGGH